MTKHQIDPRQVTDSDLTRHLLAARGTQWMRGNRGDPYALILRAQGIDPHFLYSGMRGHPALRQTETDVWVTAGHAAGAAVLDSPDLALRAPGRSRRRRIFGIDSGTSLKHVLSVDDALLAPERAEAERLRAAADAGWGTDWLTTQAPQAREVFAARLHGLDDSFDLATDFVRDGVHGCLARLLGLDREQSALLRERSLGAAPLLDSLLCPPTLAGARGLVASFDGVVELLSPVVAARAGAPGEDAVSRVLAANGGGEQAVGDALAAATLASVVGVEVTTALTTNAVLALLDHPEQWERLRSDPRLAARAVEETLRHEPPVRLESRIATQQCGVLGQEVGRGDQVVTLVDAANRDPEVFTDPESYRIDRADAGRHLSLTGASPVGFTAPLVRLLATAALTALAAHPRAEHLRTAGEAVRRMRSPVVRGVARCPVALTA